MLCEQTSVTFHLYKCGKISNFRKKFMRYFSFLFFPHLEDVGEEMDLYYTNAVTYVMKKIRMALKINFGTAAAQSFTPVDECVIIIYMSRNAHQETGVCA